MGRTARYSSDQLLAAAGELLVAGGPAKVTVQGVAAAVGAPTGSVYHRFASRDVLVASMWLAAVESFQVGLLETLDEPDPHVAARRAALHVVRWSRERPRDAHILTMYRGEDLLAGGWPASLRQRNVEQRDRVQHFLGSHQARLGASDRGSRWRVRFALIDIPGAAVRDALRRGVPPASDVDAAVLAAVDAVLATLETLTHDPREDPS